MTADKIRNRIEECVSMLTFEYNGKEGNVDPYYIPENKREEYLIFFDGYEQTVYDIETVMNTPFIDGKSLNEIADELVITEW